MGYAVAVADKDVLSVDGVGGTVAGSLELFLVALDEEIATTIVHILPLTVEIGTFDSLAAAYGHTVGALGALTAIIPRDKQIIVS